MNGAQLAGSWAVRETFVAVVTTNLPMLSPIIQLCLTTIPSAKLRSWFATMSASRRRVSGKHIDEHDAIQLREPQSGHSGKQRGHNLKSLYHITSLSESEERIMGAMGQSLQDEMIRRRDDAPVRGDGDGRASQLGGIQQQMEVTVTTEPSTLSPTELERRQMFGYIVKAPEDVGTSTTCHTAPY